MKSTKRQTSFVLDVFKKKQKKHKATLTHKKHKMQTSDFHSDIFMRIKSIKSKQVTFTHKKAQNVKQASF